jgi:hypothetical protein
MGSRRWRFIDALPPIKLGTWKHLEIGGNTAFDLVSVERYLAALMAESAKLRATPLPQPTHAYGGRAAFTQVCRHHFGGQ